MRLPLSNRRQWFRLQHLVFHTFLTISKPLSIFTIMDQGCGFSGETDFHGEKLIYPAASRNKEPILRVIQEYIQKDKDAKPPAVFLEIASGSGQHLAHFAPHYPEMRFQPTEFDESLLGSISYYARTCETHNILPPILLDITQNILDHIAENSVDYLYNANMIHISPYECTIGLFRNAKLVLKPGGLMFTYGPYSKNKHITPESNRKFDENLKLRDPSWGLRDINDLQRLAASNGIQLMDEIDMPSNNKTLIWKA